MSSFNKLGEGYFVSYRDPHLKNTLEIYQGVTEYLRNFDVSDRDMTKFIIGTISNMDQPMTPATRGDRSMNLYMNHVAEEMIRKRKAGSSPCNAAGYRNLADIVEKVLQQTRSVSSEMKTRLSRKKNLYRGQGVVLGAATSGLESLQRKEERDFDRE